VLGVLVVGLTLLLLATLTGLIDLHQWQRSREAAKAIAVADTGEPASFSRYRRMPISKLPGPTRTYGVPVFKLTEDNSQAMIGMDDPENECWCDLAGNFYASGFASRFSYANPGENGPVVRVCVEPEAAQLKGRLEAHGLKPNFAYQIKLRGLFEDRKGFEAIGYAGRWRLPGRGTNYSDSDYDWYPLKDEIESYILFDFFITDANGDAVREFALDSSLHVLFNASRQGGEALADDMVPVVVDASNPDRYLRPKVKRTLELIWAERETIRYRSADQVIRLPPGPYKAELVLTEESFHSPYNDGGYWATVCRLPISFTVMAESVTD